MPRAPATVPEGARRTKFLKFSTEADSEGSPPAKEAQKFIRSIGVAEPNLKIAAKTQI
jgi:hypothetical protein